MQGIMILVDLSLELQYPCITSLSRSSSLHVFSSFKVVCRCWVLCYLNIYVLLCFALFCFIWKDCWGQNNYVVNSPGGALALWGSIQAAATTTYLAHIISSLQYTIFEHVDELIWNENWTWSHVDKEVKVGFQLGYSNPRTQECVRAFCLFCLSRVEFSLG